MNFSETPDACVVGNSEASRGNFGKLQHVITSAKMRTNKATRNRIRLCVCLCVRTIHQADASLRTLFSNCLKANEPDRQRETEIPSLISWMICDISMCLRYLKKFPYDYSTQMYMYMRLVEHMGSIAWLFSGFIFKIHHITAWIKGLNWIGACVISTQTLLKCKSGTSLPPWFCVVSYCT